MILLLVLLAVMVGGYFGVQQFNKTESVSETAGSFDLTAKTIADLAGLNWTKDETTFSFTYSNDTWSTADQPAWPVLQSGVQTMADTLVGLQATRKLEDVKNLADYGLETPAFSVTAVWKDGSRTTYSMGDATPFADGYYLSLSGQEGTIYTIASSLSAVFNKTQKDLVATEEIPPVADVTDLSVGSTFAASKKETSITVDPDQFWYDSFTDAPLDESQIESLISSAKEIEWNELVTAAADSASLSEWQLDDGHAVTVTLSGGGESASILFGSLNEDSNYYARLPGSSMVYTVNGSDVSSLLSASAENMQVKAILPLPYDQLAGAAFTTKKGTWQLTKAVPESSEKTEEPESTDTNSEAESGEASGSDEAEKNLWKLVTALKSAGKPDTEQAGDQVLSIRAVSIAGTEISIVFSEYSAESYQAAVNGGAPLLVPADDIDSLVRSIHAMQ